MPVDTSLHEQIERVFVYSFRDPWTWQDLMFAFDAELRYSQQLDPEQSYSTLVLMHEAKTSAPGLKLSHFNYMQSHDPPNWDFMVIVRNPNHFFNPLLEAALKYPGWHGRVFVVDSPTAAEQVIHQQRVGP